MYRKLRNAGVAADLHVYDGLSHGQYMLGILTDFPESKDAQNEIDNFFRKHLK
ncbi:alpha/beta hydrolase [Colwellia sp. 12G3]|uniref:alpha/beta hydrolase n=1 Tax=Colwellia sp. 12G3 TaxID=2058299 RepID=UPI0018E2E3F0|nr:hypothetical protein [Colwellia sp. 12G3]